MEHDGARAAVGGPRPERFGAAGRRVAMAVAAPRPLAADRATTRRRVVLDLPLLSLGRGDPHSHHAARCRDTLSAGVQFFALRPQPAGQCPLFDLAVDRGGAAGVVPGLQRKT